MNDITTPQPSLDATMRAGDIWDTVITEAGLDKLIERANSGEGESLKQWVATKVKSALQ